MSLRAKTKRRLLILIGLTLLVGAGLFWVVRGPAARRQARAAVLRKDGMALYAGGDHAAALPKLGEYLTLVKINQKEPTDAELEALFALADARRQIPLPNRHHVREASDAFKRYLDYRPADVKAQRLQADLLSRMGRHADAVAAADQVLRQHPDDREALAHRASGLYRQPKPDLAEVERAVGKLLAVDPGNVRGLMLSQDLKLKAGVLPQELIDRAERLAADRKDDPRFFLVAAQTYTALARAIDLAQPDAAGRRAAWDKQARDWLQKAADQPPTDAEFAAQLVANLDRHGMFGRSVPYLKSAVEKLAAAKPAADKPAADKPDADADVADLERALVRRLWQNGAYGDVLDRTAKLDANDLRSDADLLAYRALALQARAAMPSAGDTRTELLNKAEQVTRALTARANSGPAQAWALVLRAGVDRGGFARPGADRLGGTQPAADARRSSGELVTLFRQARGKDPDNAVATARLGDAYAMQGETESAVQMWEMTARQQFDWGYPHARIGEARLTEGRADEAERRAALAYVRSPTNRPFVALLLQARYANLGKDPKPAALEPLLADVERAQQAYPNDPGTLPLQVALLAKVRGPGPAAARLTAALDAKPPLPPETLLQLQAADAAHQLGQADAITAALGKLEGADLAVAVRRASDLMSAGDPAEGLKILEAARAKARAEADPRWMLAIAAYRDQTNDPGAAKAWAELGDRTAKELYFQTQILKGNARFRDRELWRKTIDRVRGLTGDEGSLWRTERARWLLADVDAGEKERAEAIALLTELARRDGESAEAHRLLGMAFARDGKPDRAADALAVAFARAPARADVGLELVAALRAIGNNKDAAARLTEAAALPSLTPEQRVRAAAHFEALGQPEPAVRLLLAAPEGGERDARLGRLYRATGRAVEAAAAYRRVLNDPAARPGDVFTGADFFAAAGDAAATKLFLDRLQTMPQSDAVTQMALGQFEEAYGSPDKARGHLAKATELQPKNALGWRALTGYLVRARKYDEAAKAVDAGLAAIGGADPELAALKPLIQAIRGLADAEAVRPLIDYLTRDPANPAANDMLKALADGQAAATAAAPNERAAVEARTRDRLAKLAEQHPGFWPLQEEVIRHRLGSNEPEQAAELAERAIPTFPALEAPPRYAAAAHAATARWDKVIEAATVWRQRTPGDPVPADIALAGALIGKQQRLAAAQTLEPHVRANPLPAAGADPATGPALKPYTLSLYGTYGRALIGAGRPSDAAERLAPLLSLGTDGWRTWLALARAHQKPDQAKQWVERAAEAVKPTAPVGERLALADAWFQAGRATSSDALMKQAADLLEPMTTGPSPSRQAVALSAYVAHFRGDYAEAERLWRVVKTRNASPDVSNNLAYALLLGGRAEAVTEARALADQAVAADPHNPDFLGTQARAMARQGQREAAIRTFRQVLSKDNRNVEAMVGLAEELAKGSPQEKEDARKLLVGARQRVDEDPEPVTPELKKQLEGVRASIETPDGK